MPRQMTLIEAFKASSIKDQMLGVALFLGAATVIGLVIAYEVVRFLAYWRVAFG